MPGSQDNVAIDLPNGFQPSSRDGQGNLDGHALRNVDQAELDDRLSESIRRRVEAGNLVLPQLPETALKIMELLGDANADIEDIEEVIETDPSLCGEVLRLASSPLYGAPMSLRTVGDAVRRVGFRGLRGLVLALSFKGTVFRDRRLVKYASEVWRQARSVGEMGRAVAPMFGLEPAEAFLLALLSDIGKVAMMDLLSQEIQRDGTLMDLVHTGLVGDALYRNHEMVGGAMAEDWGLSADLVSVASCHHRYYENDEHPRQAAFVSFIHRLDLYLSEADEEAFLGAAKATELDFVGLSVSDRGRILSTAYEAFRSLHCQTVG